MSVLGRKVGRADIRLIRGDTERVGVRWRQRNCRTGQVTPVDVSQWTARLVMTSPDGQETWYETPCDELTNDGLVACTIPATAFTGSLWALRPTGQWKIIATQRGGVTRTLAWGYWTLGQ